MRGHGEGSVRYLAERKRWQARASIDGSQRSFYGATRKEALDKMREAQAAAKRGRLAGTGQQTTEKYLRSWLASVEGKVRYKTLESYRLSVDRIAPQIGGVRLDRLTAHKIQEALDAMPADGHSARAVQQTRTVLHTAFERAVALDLLPTNPVARTEAPKVERAERPTLSEDELAALFAGSTDDRLHALWVTLGTSGLRLGEALGLTWQDVDLERGTITVRQALQRQDGRGLVSVEPKSRTAKRTVEIGPLTVEALRSHRERQTFARKAKRAAGLWTDTGLVFASEVGTGLEQSKVRKLLVATLERLGLPSVRVHDLRHTAASRMMANGVAAKVVQERLGHSSIVLTLGTYSHVAPGMQRQAAEALEAGIAAKMRAN